MARFYFPGDTVEQLKARLERLKDERSNGFISEVDSEGLKSRKEKGTSVDTRIAMVVNDLSVLLPDEFDPEDYVTTTKVKAIFSGALTEEE